MSVAGKPSIIDDAATSNVISEPDQSWTVPWLLADRIARTPDSPIIERKAALGHSWAKVTARGFGDDVARVASGLMGMGLEPGQRVSIMAHTSYEWTLLDMAVARAGLVSVPIYETDSASQVQWILQDADVRLVITESAALAELVRGAAAARAAAHPDAAEVRVLVTQRLRDGAPMPEVAASLGWTERTLRRRLAAEGAFVVVADLTEAQKTKLKAINAELAELARGSIRACLASPTAKQTWLAEVDAWLAAPDQAPQAQSDGPEASDLKPRAVAR